MLWIQTSLKTAQISSFCMQNTKSIWIVLQNVKHEDPGSLKKYDFCEMQIIGISGNVNHKFLWGKPSYTRVSLK